MSTSSSLEAEIERCIEKLRESLKKFDERAKELAERIESSGALRELAEPRTLPRAMGLDSSMARASPHPSTHIAIVRAALIESSLSTGFRVLKDVFRIELVEVPRRVVDDVVEDLMLAIETSLVREVPEGATVLIDGPIVDPPRPQSPYSPKLLRDVVGIEDLHGYRARCIANLLMRGMRVVGFVKRIEGTSSGGEPLEPLLRRALAILRKRRGREVYALLDVEREHPEALAPYRSLGIEILHAYALYGDRVVRIDVPCLRACREDAIDIVERVLSLPRLKSMPLPVALAHERCRIGKDVAELVERCIARKMLVIDPSAIELLGP